MARDYLVAQTHLAGAERIKAGYDVEQGRFSAPRGANENREATRFDLERAAFESNDGPLSGFVHFAHAPYVQRGALCIRNAVAHCSHRITSRATPRTNRLDRYPRTPMDVI